MSVVYKKLNISSLNRNRAFKNLKTQYLSIYLVCRGWLGQCRISYLNFLEFYLIIWLLDILHSMHAALYCSTFQLFLISLSAAVTAHNMSTHFVFKLHDVKLELRYACPKNIRFDKTINIKANQIIYSTSLTNSY